MKLFILILSFIVINDTLGDPDKCNLDHCKGPPEYPAYLCASPNPCDGILTKEGGPNCSCCEVCLKYIEEGASCGKWNPCRPGLDCTNGKCKKQ